MWMWMLSSAGDQLILANIHKLVPMAHASYYARRRETNPLKTQMNQYESMQATCNPPKGHFTRETRHGMLLQIAP